MSNRRDVIVATYPLKDADEARAHRDRLIAGGQEAFLTREMGELRYSGVMNVHVNPPRLPRVSKIVI